MNSILNLTVIFFWFACRYKHGKTRGPVSGFICLPSLAHAFFAWHKRTASNLHALYNCGSSLKSLAIKYCICTKAVSQASVILSVPNCSIKQDITLASPPCTCKLNPLLIYQINAKDLSNFHLIVPKSRFAIFYVSNLRKCWLDSVWNLRKREREKEFSSTYICTVLNVLYSYIKITYISTS